MREQLSILIELQKVETENSRINITKNRELPNRIIKLDEALGAFNACVEKERKKLDELNKKHREKEEKLKRGNESLKKSKERLFEVKTNREYQAILKEIEIIEGKNSEIEDEIISLLEEIDGIRAVLKTKERELETHQQQYEQEKRKIEEEMRSLDSDLLSCEQKIRDLRMQINNGLLKRYETIKVRNNGLAVVSVWKEVCDGCHMNIQPQLYNELQKSSALLSCPNCNRIIYWYNKDKRG
ncbi:MAG: C4-type zinc ribbon domain-containing protein [Syntrophales bacterium]|nr:C4-type zinc ribbon domain-containing protein [Syntrophales bacterium]